jgi:hypothetical protein
MTGLTSSRMRGLLRDVVEVEDLEVTDPVCALAQRPLPLGEIVIDIHDDA